MTYLVVVKRLEFCIDFERERAKETFNATSGASGLVVSVKIMAGLLLLVGFLIFGYLFDRSFSDFIQSGNDDVLTCLGHRLNDLRLRGFDHQGGSGPIGVPEIKTRFKS
jgi:hypothetical protein